MSTSAFAFESIEVGSIAKKLNVLLISSLEGMAEKAFVTCEGTVRYRYDGGEPTSMEGHLLKDGSHLILHGELQMKNFRAISVSEPAILSVSFERP